MTTEQIADALSAPFEVREVKWKPQSVKGNRALAIAYIDARLVMDRLDEVFGHQASGSQASRRGGSA